MAAKKPPSLILRNMEYTYRLSELATLLPDEPSYNAVRNWCCEGFKINGRVVHMEKIDSTVGYKSSIEAYYRFLSAINNEEHA